MTIEVERELRASSGPASVVPLKAASAKPPKSSQMTSGDSGLFLALDVARFMPLEDFHTRMEGFVGILKGSAPDGDVLLPGEVRWETLRRSRREGNRVHADRIAEIDVLARPHGLVGPWDVPA